MAAASSTNPIKQVVGSTYSAGFDITARTAIDGRMVVATLNDLTNEATWCSRSEKDSEHPQYWLYNGLVTSVVETGKIYVLIGIDESQPSTYWPYPAAPGLVSTGPRWVEVGGVDNFLQEASIVIAKYGYISETQEAPDYYESGDPHFDHVYTDNTLTTEADPKNYLKLVVKESGNTGSIVIKTIYCDVQNLIGNVGQSLNVRGNGTIATTFNGSENRNVNFVGESNIVVNTTYNTGIITTGLAWSNIQIPPPNIPGEMPLDEATLFDLTVEERYRPYVDEDGLHFTHTTGASSPTNYAEWIIRSGETLDYQVNMSVYSPGNLGSKMLVELLNYKTGEVEQTGETRWFDTPDGPVSQYIVLNISKGRHKLRIHNTVTWSDGYVRSVEIVAASQQE